jgi:pyruvate/2-oxoglutarate dehydrogenase complex dihydrolipoamide acyltransferase (E2) component
MAVEILMPALSPTMEEGTLAKWLVKVGDKVKSGQIIAEIETDKATMEFEAVDEGIISQLLVAAGTAGVKVNAPIAVIVEEGESLSAAPKPAPPVAAVSAPVAVAAAVAMTDADETLILGDQLDTDIQLGRSSGVLAVLTLTGEAARRAPEMPEIKPDLSVSGPGELLAMLRDAGALSRA